MRVFGTTDTRYNFGMTLNLTNMTVGDFADGCLWPIWDNRKVAIYRVKTEGSKGSKM